MVTHNKTDSGDSFSMRVTKARSLAHLASLFFRFLFSLFFTLPFKLSSLPLAVAFAVAADFPPLLSLPVVALLPSRQRCQIF